MQPVMYSDTMDVITPREPGPKGSVYQAQTQFFSTDQNAPVIAQGVPPASNFGSVKFPVDIWSPNVHYGMPLDMYKGSNHGSR